MNGARGRSLWINIDSLTWFLSYAADELAHHGIVLPYRPSPSPSSHEPNLETAPGVWMAYEPRFKRYQFMYVEHVDGLPEGNINARRYIQLKAITDDVWHTFGDSTPYDELKVKQKRDVCKVIATQWCEAILAGTESDFLTANGLPGWQQCSSSAQAASSDTSIADTTNASHEILSLIHI